MIRPVSLGDVNPTAPFRACTYPYRTATLDLSFKPYTSAFRWMRATPMHNIWGWCNSTSWNSRGSMVQCCSLHLRVALLIRKRRPRLLPRMKIGGRQCWGLRMTYVVALLPKTYSSVRPKWSRDQAHSPTLRHCRIFWWVERRCLNPDGNKQNAS